MDEIIIRKVNVDDAEKLIKYVQGIAGESDYLTFGIGEFNPSIEEEIKIIESFSNSDNSLFIIAEVDGEIVGNISFRGGVRSRARHIGEFGISVKKTHWGNGIGKALLNFLINWAKNSGVIRKINLRTREDNERAKKLYEKMGFVQTGKITRDLLINGVFYDSLIYGLEID